ncbi:glycosyltransferase family 4 protein [uncultured Clostridium sp.]|uniref:glycosyltransferase family 4 protein n=1 Tax=uncultured Clostridium sp. TaxID=59620 RepID=UPI00272CD99E|nr:glycosyltransferase family 4 protein [uncultured Clostridium sp.]
MKITFLTLDIFGMGGTIRTVLNIANYLVNNGYDVEVVSVLRYRKEPFFYIDPKIRIVVLHSKLIKKTNRKGIKGKIVSFLDKSKSVLIHPDDEGHHHFSLLTDIKMYKYLKSIKDGVLISTRPSFNIFVSKYINKNVITIGQEHLNLSIYPKRLQKSIKRYYPKLKYLATLTDDDTLDYKKLFSDKKIKIVKLTNSIPPFESKLSTLEDKTILAAGRLVPQKGFDLLIEAFEKIIDKAPDWKVKIFGAGKDKEMLQNMISEKHLYNNVLLMGPTKEIEKELTQSSIYALSSRFEGFGMVIIEAMQCGVPVVSFDCPKGPGEIIANNEDGILVENGNVDAFAEALLELIEDKNKRIEFSKNAIKNVKRYTIDEIGKEWDRILKEIPRI